MPDPPRKTKDDRLKELEQQWVNAEQMARDPAQMLGMAGSVLFPERKLIQSGIQGLAGLGGGLLKGESIGQAALHGLEAAGVPLALHGAQRLAQTRIPATDPSEMVRQQHIEMLKAPPAAPAPEALLQKIRAQGFDIEFYDPATQTWALGDNTVSDLGRNVGRVRTPPKEVTEALNAWNRLRLDEPTGDRVLAGVPVKK